jgi:hypothetical protein
MGKVKALWEEERQARADKRIAELQIEGYSMDEATQIAWDEQEQLDEANGQFGVGA